MNGFAALDIPPCRRYVVVKATAGFAVCRLILKLLLFYSCLDFTQNWGKTLIKWQDEHPEFTRIVFHGLRHSSATYQLMISGGDVKAVQGTTGHASANLLVNTYAHIQQDSRKKLGKRFEEGFYKPGATLVQAAPVEAEPTISVSALLELLKDADPSVKAQLRLALLT